MSIYSDLENKRKRKIAFRHSLFLLMNLQNHLVFLTDAEDIHLNKRLEYVRKFLEEHEKELDDGIKNQQKDAGIKSLMTNEDWDILVNFERYIIPNHWMAE